MQTASIKSDVKRHFPPASYLGFHAEQELLEAVEIKQESWKKAISYRRKEDALKNFATFHPREAG